MTPEKIIEVVADYAAGEYSKREVTHLQRYFIRRYCPWLPLRRIANLTGIKSHDAVIDSIEIVERQLSFSSIKWDLSVKFNSYIHGVVHNLSSGSIVYRGG